MRLNRRWVPLLRENSGASHCNGVGQTALDFWAPLNAKKGPARAWPTAWQQGCSNRESRESRGAKKRRFGPNREALIKIPNRQICKFTRQQCSGNLLCCTYFEFCCRDGIESSLFFWTQEDSDGWKWNLRFRWLYQMDRKLIILYLAKFWCLKFVKS